MRMALSTLSQVFGSIILIAIVQQYFLIAVAVVFIIYADFFRVYRYSARDIKRLDNVLRSGLYAHFSESLSGLATLRYAYVTSSQPNAEIADHTLHVEHTPSYRGSSGPIQNSWILRTGPIHCEYHGHGRQNCNSDVLHP